MNKQSNQGEPDPSLDGPDYLSLVIEWEAVEDEATADDDTAKQTQEWDIVDEASDESFPASDPPAWGSAHAAPSYSTAHVVEEPVARSRTMSRIRRILMAVAALGGLFAFVQHVRHRHA